jgi:hypothetical protein
MEIGQTDNQTMRHLDFLSIVLWQITESNAYDNAAEW